MATFTSSTFLGGAGRFYATSNSSWAAVRGAASASSNAATYEVESDYDAGNWYIQRVFLPIDTSTIPTTATITGVTLNFNARYEQSQTSTVVHLIQTTQATTGSRDNADFNNVSFTSGGSVATPDASLTAKSITGNATSLGWIVKGGTTLIGLISAADQGNVDPNGGTEHFCTITAPELVVTYTLPSTATGSFHFM